MCDLFFDLVRVSLGNKCKLRKPPNEKEWLLLFNMCKQHAIVGVAFKALEILTNQKPPPSVLFQWIGFNEKIIKLNGKVNHNAVEVCKDFEKDGFDYCILKGQGNNLLYPDPWVRTPGDIDLWVRTKSDERCQKNGLRNIIKYVKRVNPTGKVMYHHIDMGFFHGTEVEVHYRPSFMFNPIHNRRLQKWYVAHDLRLDVELPDETGRIPIPNRMFNIVFQLSHVYNHLLHEGIGLRQVIDYYYLLRNAENEKIEGLNNVSSTLKYLGLEKIAGAMMWVLNEVLGLPEEFLIAPKDERRGKVLLDEIMRGGNFGHYDTENQKANSAIKKNLQRIKRDIRMMRYFPSECLWEPIFRFYHWGWRMAHS